MRRLCFFSVLILLFSVICVGCTQKAEGPKPLLVWSGMDTEFPGVVFPCPKNTSDFYYQYIKTNVDKLNLIQLGITLTNSKGERPPNTSTWQFNLKFDKDREDHSTESISLLENCGINFNKLKKEGIPYELFGEYLLNSGMVLNENLTWISFNGLSDFAYLLNYFQLILEKLDS